jgi:hypothetical protein
MLKEGRFVKCSEVCFVCYEAISTSISTPAGTFTKNLKKWTCSSEKLVKMEQPCDGPIGIDF